MNPAQREWMLARAKAHAPIFIGREQDNDTVMARSLARQLESWAEDDARDAQARQECRRLALMLDRAADGEDVEDVTTLLSDSDVETILSWQKSHGESASRWGEPSDRSWALYELGVEMRLRLWLGRWGASALPLIKIPDANWVAAMCATNVAPEYLEMLRLPWPAFAIDVPPGTGLRFGNNDYGLDDNEVSTIGVHRVIPTLGKKVLVDRDERYDGSQQWVCLMSWDPGKWKQAAYMHRQMAELGDDLDGVGRGDAQYARCQKMISKLVAGVLMAIQAGQIRQSSTGKKRAARRGDLPSCEEYIVGQPVHVRMVDFVREYVSVGPKKMRGPRTVRTLVRGHWKWQPHGPRNALRKWQHIEPYWTGANGAPVVVRPHIMHEAK